MINGKKVLIIGGSSLLGKYLLMTAPTGNYITATWCRNYQEGIDWQMNITKKQSIHYVFDVVKPDYVILCSAIGSVDYCERHYQEAYEVNVVGVRNVIAACGDYDSTLMYCSSNAVFKGDDAPYSENDLTGPVNMYGFMKVTAEQDVDNLLHYQIVRPIMLYGYPFKHGRGNWVTFVTESLKAGKPVRVVDDVMTQPTHALHCARIMWHILDREQPGIWHVAGEETMSLWEFARLIAHVWGYDREMVMAIKSDDSMLKGMAPRPVDPTYCLDKMHSINMHASARTIDGLRRMWSE